LWLERKAQQVEDGEQHERAKASLKERRDHNIRN
jgi:hypothetical protein